MPPSAHNQQSRVSGSSTASGTSDSSNGSASYQLILDHVLTYPAANEMPLRTMYTLNCVPRSQASATRNATPSSSTNSSPQSPQSPFPNSNATQTFHESLLAQMSQLSHQPSQLPPSFMTSFIQKCFSPELVMVDFPQSLTGLDYLKDLETRRRREVAAAMKRLEISRDSLHEDAFDLRFPGVAQWMQEIEEKERKMDSLYTTLYISIRRWILINEMSLLPFNRHNCLAMLNTLYPPVMKVQPTNRLTQPILQSQREGYFKYIQQVEKSGPHVLRNLLLQGKAPDDENGWLAVVRTLSMYLQVANSIISECVGITSLQDIHPPPSDLTAATSSSKHSRKADSGICFTHSSDRRPSNHSSTTGPLAEPTSPSELSWPKPRTAPRTGTALEKLARGLRTIGRSRTDVTEMVREQASHPSPPPAAATPVVVVEKQNILRKMRSMGSLDVRAASRAGTPNRQLAETPEPFDSEAMRRQRMRFERSSGAARKLGQMQIAEI